MTMQYPKLFYSGAKERYVKQWQTPIIPAARPNHELTAAHSCFNRPSIYQSITPVYAKLTLKPSRVLFILISKKSNGRKWLA